MHHFKLREGVPIWVDDIGLVSNAYTQSLSEFNTPQVVILIFPVIRDTKTFIRKSLKFRPRGIDMADQSKIDYRPISSNWA